LAARGRVGEKDYASGFDSPAALPGSRRVSARQGWAGEEGWPF